MKRRVQLLAVTIALAGMAIPAAAQVRVRDHRKKDPPPPAMKVTDWSPKNGPIGTTVTINGENFSRSTELVFGGSPLKPRRLSEKQITFIVPQSYGDGKIVLRDGYGPDYAVGSYAVIMPPDVSGYEPRAGVYGTQVEIRGSFFENGDRVLINGKPIKIVSIAPDRIVCEIPDWATTDWLVVSREGGYESKTRGKFRVLPPQPSIARINPDYGPPGSKVRLEGTNFTDKDRFFYGRMPVAVADRGANWVDVVVPDRAFANDYFSVRGPGGKAQSPSQFNIVVPPRIARFEPDWGAPGARVEVYGDNFREGDRLQIGGQWVKVVQIRPGQITIEVPQNAQSGALVLWRDKEQWSAGKPFNVAYPPQISDWGPHDGDYGTRVTLRGSHFDDSCEVFYGSQKLRVASRNGDTAIEVIVPRGVKDDFFTIRSRYGEAKTGKAFQIYARPELRGFSPKSGRPKSEVFVRGANFNDRTRILIGQWPARIVQLKGDRGIVIEVPANATAGEWDIWVQDGDYKEKANKPFLVQGYATLDGIDKWRATYGDTIVLSGSGLVAGVKVLYGNTELSVKKWGGNQAWIDIPSGLSAGSDWITIDDAGNKVKSSQKFEIYAPDPNIKVHDHRRRR